MHTSFDIVPDGAFWVVRCQSAEYGRYRTQIQAFNAAVAEARKIKEAGRLAHVRVVRERNAPKGDFLSAIAARTTSHTPSIFVSTSLFQNLRTR